MASGFGQQGLMPALDSDMAKVITQAGSEFIVKDCNCNK
jgi:hypothetical protein